MISIEEMASFCRRKGFVYPNSEIYGGMAEMKNNIKQNWWKFHVNNREDIVGIDGSIITHPKIWEASGHVAGFADIMLECKKCNERYRADQLIEDVLKIKADGLSVEDVNKILKQNKVKCLKCSNSLTDANEFNLMFETYVGPKRNKDNITFLRPETAQLMFTNFKYVVENSRLKLPFGIAQTGKAFRNEISPRHFLFRCREFEQMEIEYFIHPDKIMDCPHIHEVLNYEILVYSAEMQKKDNKPVKMSMKKAMSGGMLKPWHAYWLSVEHKWFVDLGVNEENLRVRQHLSDEKSHYALDTWDLEYKFPFGWKELQGIANRTDFDLKQHIKHSKKDLTLYDEESKKKIIPHVVAEPSLGVDRTFLVFMFNAYDYDKDRKNIVLKLHPKLAPIKAAVLPLVNKLNKEAKKVYDGLKSEFNCFYDSSGSIGRRYARMDESGTPYCITFDFDSLKDKKVTIRNRDDTKQARIPIKNLKNILNNLINYGGKFSEL